MLQVRALHKNYGQLAVLRGVDLDLQTGELAALVGSSGAGKTTLLQIIGTLDKPDTGEVLFEGRSLFTQKANALAQFRNQTLGFVFQFHYLMAEFTALENVCMPALIQGKSLNTARRRALELLDSMGLAARAAHYPNQLSGGEAQRVAVARALINKPKLVLADEPTGNLDSTNSEALFALFRQLAAEWQVALLIATHNEQFARSVSRCIHIRDGQIVAE